MRSSTLRKLHVGEGKLGERAIRGTVWEDLATPDHRVTPGQLATPDHLSTPHQGDLSEATLREELMRLFAVAMPTVPLTSTPRGASTGGGSNQPRTTQLLDPKQSHLKAISIRALATSLQSLASPADQGTHDAIVSCTYRSAAAYLSRADANLTGGEPDLAGGDRDLALRSRADAGYASSSSPAAAGRPWEARRLAVAVAERRERRRAASRASRRASVASYRIECSSEAASAKMASTCGWGHGRGQG